MGIDNIHILTDIKYDDTLSFRMALAAKEELLIEAHRRGEHHWGSMRRDCPLCQK